MNKLVLGTVQFGLAYGLANKTGQVEKASVVDILQYAKQKGVDTLDTAITYGESEYCLGQIGVEGWHIITKLPECPCEGREIFSWVESQIQSSLKRLNVTYVDGLLLHRPMQLLSSEGEDLWQALETIKEKGYVGKIGFSIYAPDELDALYSYYKPDIVQVSYNICDRRIKSSGWLEKMHNDKVEVHIRSIFLQGLLLMSSSERPEKFNRWSELWASWDNWLQKNNIAPLEACLGFAMKEAYIDKFIVGIDSKVQLAEILNVLDNNTIEFPDKFEMKDLDLINPSHWSSL